MFNFNVCPRDARCAVVILASISSVVLAVVNTDYPNLQR